MKMTHNVSLFSLFATLILFTACGEAPDHTGDQHMETPYESLVSADGEIDEMVAVIHPTEGNRANGVIRFIRQTDGVRIQAEVHGLEPGSLHGFHIHQYGDCTAGDATSAGGHYNPYDRPHASPHESDRHMGDLGNLESDREGTASLDYLDPVLRMEGASSILGRGVIVHAGEDDFETQPTGDAGGRIGCGVIGVAGPPN